MCERAGVLFYADEAWAAYLNFHPFYTFGRGKGDTVRYNAVNETCGAHFAVQSTHKTLAAFSQASMIHVSTRFKHLLEEDSAPQFRWLRRRVQRLQRDRGWRRRRYLSRWLRRCRRIRRRLRMPGRQTGHRRLRWLQWQRRIRRWRSGNHHQRIRRFGRNTLFRRRRRRRIGHQSLWRIRYIRNIRRRRRRWKRWNKRKRRCRFLEYRRRRRRRRLLLYG